ncbi:MAG: hypothetical protein LAT64_05415 [Phycisphaerales bacterium]|nr:RedB protein [Planctomycetota bacterium]MCH8508194.1 hypothetical protein [Phycisphaerales bacterium]
MAVSVWALFLTGGAGYLAAHGARAGEAGSTPAAWPDRIERAEHAWAVVLAAHPRCPCTRATAAELITALAGASEAYELIVLAYRPSGDAAFADTGVIRRLGSLPHARVVDDPDGRVAAGFGALTSGHAALYDPAGRLRFSGGLTPSRAHIGPNTGAGAVRSLLRGGGAPAAHAPVYGCPLDNDDPHLLLGGCAPEGDHACTP